METEGTVQHDKFEPLWFGMPRGSITLTTFMKTDSFWQESVCVDSDEYDTEES